MRDELSSGVPVEVAHPVHGTPTAGLVLCPDIMGLRPLFDSMAQRLADQNGWVVVSPEHFAGHEAMSLEDRLGWVPHLDDAVEVATLVEAADSTGQDRVSILGFCFGGMWALKGAASGRFHRAVSFYGMIRMPRTWQSPSQADAIALLAGPSSCPVIELVGSEDAWVPADDIEALRNAGSEVVVYPGADHGFVHDPDRPAHRPGDAADAWSRAIAFIGEP